MAKKKKSYERMKEAIKKRIINYNQDQKIEFFKAFESLQNRLEFMRLERIAEFFGIPTLPVKEVRELISFIQSEAIHLGIVL